MMMLLLLMMMMMMMMMMIDMDCRSRARPLQDLKGRSRRDCSFGVRYSTPTLIRLPGVNCASGHIVKS